MVMEVDLLRESQKGLDELVRLEARESTVVLVLEVVLGVGQTQGVKVELLEVLEVLLVRTHPARKPLPPRTSLLLIQQPQGLVRGQHQVMGLLEEQQPPSPDTGVPQRVRLVTLVA